MSDTIYGRNSAMHMPTLNEQMAAAHKAEAAQVASDNMLCQCNSNELTYCNAVGRYCDPGKKCLIAQHPFAGR